MVEDEVFRMRLRFGMRPNVGTFVTPALVQTWRFRRFGFVRFILAAPGWTAYQPPPRPACGFHHGSGNWPRYEFRAPQPRRPEPSSAMKATKRPASDSGTSLARPRARSHLRRQVLTSSRTGGCRKHGAHICGVFPASAVPNDDEDRGNKPEPQFHWHLARVFCAARSDQLMTSAQTGDASLPDESEISREACPVAWRGPYRLPPSTCRP